MLGVALAALATGVQAQPRRHAPPKDDRDARIEALETQVRDLVGEVRQLKAAQQASPAAATPATPGVASAPAVGLVSAGATVLADSASGSPAPSSPDTPRPVTSSTPSPVTGGATILAGRPAIASPDGRFTANLHGVMQFDAADYLQDHARAANVDLRRGAAAGDTAHARDLNDGSVFRRARIGIDGKVFGDFEYNVLFDFGGAGVEDAGHVQELWVQYSRLKPFHLRVGAFRPWLGLEDQGSTNGQPFLERPASTDVGASVAGADYREGAGLWAATDRWFASLGLATRQVGIAGSAANGTAQAFDTNLGMNGRLAALPFVGDDWLTHIGVHGSYAFQLADAGGPDTAVGASRYSVTFQERPELRVDGTRLVSTGAIEAVHANTAGFEAAAQWRNLFVQGEWEHYGIERRNSLLSDPEFHGWYVEGSWILTGERRRYNSNTFAFDAPPVDHPFDIANRTVGAVELAMRYSDLDLNYHRGAAGLAIPTDGVRGGDQRIFSTAVDWYLNPIVRFVLEYQHVDVSRLSPSATTYATPVGAQIGQTYNTFSIRSQLAF